MIGHSWNVANKMREFRIFMGPEGYFWAYFQCAFCAAFRALLRQGSCERSWDKKSATRSCLPCRYSLGVWLTWIDFHQSWSCGGLSGMILVWTNLLELSGLCIQHVSFLLVQGLGNPQRLKVVTLLCSKLLTGSCPLSSCAGPVEILGRKSNHLGFEAQIILRSETAVETAVTCDHSPGSWVLNSGGCPSFISTLHLLFWSSSANQQLILGNPITNLPFGDDCYHLFIVILVGFNNPSPKKELSSSFQVGEEQTEQMSETAHPFPTYISWGIVWESAENLQRTLYTVIDMIISSWLAVAVFWRPVRLKVTKVSGLSMAECSIHEE